MKSLIALSENKKIAIDLNCDLGEGIGNESRIMPFISSANIACGYHAGDMDSMKSCVDLAIQHGVAIGAHPSFYDRENFGRTELPATAPEVYDLVTRQVQSLATIACEAGTKLHHVKPHGALYNMAARTRSLAAVIALAVKDVDQNLIIYGSRALVSEARMIGMKAANEVFADRKYNADGSLVSRKIPGSLLSPIEKAIDQALQMINTGTVESITGVQIPLEVDTVCVHGDGPRAEELVKLLHDELDKLGISIRPPEFS